MRVLRTTMWAPDLTPGATMVIAETSLKVPIEEAMEPAPGLFMTHEVFEAPEGVGELRLTFLAEDRTTKESKLHEKNMAMLFYWNLFSPDADMVKPGGTITQTRPSPLSVEDIKSVFEQIKVHPRFKEKPVTMIALSDDMETVTLTASGEIRS